MFKYVFFDLDGTLTDPGLGITNSIMHVYEHYGFEVPPREELYSYIGPPLIPSFMEKLGMDEVTAKEALSVYREYFTVKGIFENTLYDGVIEGLQELTAAGVRCVMATSKPEEFAKLIAEHFGFAQYFTLIAGNTLDESRPTKKDVITYALDTLAVSPDECIMIGDRFYDLEGAQQCGMACICALWGYGNKKEFLAAGGECFASDISSAVNVILTGGM